MNMSVVRVDPGVDTLVSNLTYVCVDCERSADDLKQKSDRVNDRENAVC